MRVILIHQHDPSINYAGGIGTFIRTFIAHAPADLDIDLIGVTANPRMFPLGRWQQLVVGKKSFRFLPLVAAHPVHRGGVPLSLRLTMALARHQRQIDTRGAIFEFHRIEPSLAVRNLRNPKVLFLHAHMQDLYNPKTEVTWKRAPWLYFWLERRLIGAMRRIYFVREDAVPYYRARYPHLAERVRFLPTWADEGVFCSMEETERLRIKQELARAYSFHPASQLLLFVGRFEGQKNPLLLLETFRRLNGQVGNALLVLIGAGSLEDRMRSFIQQQGLQNTVRILEPRPQPEIARWMNAANCLCLSSAYEGMPRVVVEALRCGLPVVGPDVGETRRLIQTEATGRLVREQTPEALVQAVVELLRQRPNRQACQQQVASYTAAKVLAPVYAYYRQLYEQGR